MVLTSDLTALLVYNEGLEKDLLPIQLDYSSGDLEHTIHSHRKLANEHYDDAVKHLKQALCSSPPLFAALLPLVQVSSSTL